MSVIGKLSQQTQLVILGVLVLIMCGVFYVYMIRPLQREIANLEQDITRLEKEVAEGQAVRAQLAELKQAVQEQEQRLAYLREVLPEKKETAEIIRKVQELAVASHLKIKSFTPRATIRNAFYEEWPILLAMEGNYHNLGTFFEQVSSFTRIINIDNISLKGIEEGATRDRTLTATCRATTFVFVESAEEPESEP